MEYFQTATRSAIDVALLGNFDAGDIPLSTSEPRSLVNLVSRVGSDFTV